MKPRLRFLLNSILVAVACMLGFEGCAKKDDVLTPGNFTREYAECVRKAKPASKIEIVRDLELRIKDPEKEETTTFLDNCYTEYCANPKEKSATIAKYIAALTESEFNRGKVNPTRITPVIKDVAWIHEIQQTMRERNPGKIPENVYEPFNDQLLIVYAEDSPKNLRYLTPKDIEEIGWKKEELRKLAVKNLRGLLPEIQLHGGNGVFMLTAGGDYEASLLLLDDIWVEKKIKVDGDYVVAIPARDMLLIAGSNDKVGIDKIRKIAKEATAQAAYRLTDDLFVFREGRFIKFVE